MYTAYINRYLSFWYDIDNTCSYKFSSKSGNAIMVLELSPEITGWPCLRPVTLTRSISIFQMESKVNSSRWAGPINNLRQFNEKLKKAPSLQLAGFPYQNWVKVLLLISFASLCLVSLHLSLILIASIFSRISMHCLCNFCNLSVIQVSFPRNSQDFDPKKWKF